MLISKHFKRIVPIGIFLSATTACGTGVESEGDFNFENLMVRREDPALVLVSFRLSTKDNDTPEPFLTLNDFELSEDRRPLSPAESQVRLVQRTRAFQRDTVIMLDFSFSVVTSTETFNQLLDSSRSLAQLISGESDVAVYYFDGRVMPVLIHGFGSPNPAASIEMFRSHTVVDGSTNLHGAVSIGLDILDERRRNFENSGLDEELYGGSLVVFTDGTHSAGFGDGYPNRNETLDDVSRSDHAIFAVGVEGEIDTEFLSTVGRDGFEIADAKGNLIPAFNRIGEVFDRFANSYYTIAYCSPSRAGSHEFSIFVRERRELRGSATISFNADGFAAGCNRELLDERFPAVSGS